LQKKRPTARAKLEVKSNVFAERKGCYAAILIASKFCAIRGGQVPVEKCLMVCSFLVQAAAVIVPKINCWFNLIHV
ncbi:MAG: hypothetical protein K6T29_10970, partial [Peptococcaceae bacterium]|nr:hypothetical protein [Peptococcaceae bacterium]